MKHILIILSSPFILLGFIYKWITISFGVGKQCFTDFFDWVDK